MTILLAKVTLTLLWFLPVLLVLSKRLSQGKNNVIQIENQPFELECIVNGTKNELDNSKIKWTRPGRLFDIRVPPEGDSHANITVKKGDSKLISTLHVPRPSNFTNLQHYQCEVSPSTPDEISQLSFLILVLKEKAVPKMKLKTKLQPAKLGKTVGLNCTVSYDNDNFNNKYDLIISWKKDGESLATKAYEYKTGKNIETLQYSLVIKSFKDGGEYVCSWELKFRGSSISRNSTVDLPVLSKRLSQEKYNVIQIENQPFELECIVTGTKNELDNSKVKWTRPGRLYDIPVPPEGDSQANITVKKGDGKLISTLHVPRPSNFTNLQHYQCEVTPSTRDEINQQSFLILVLKEKAVPKMQLKTKLQPAKLGKTVVLNCTVSYDNDNFNNKYDLVISWKKDEQSIAAKTYKYKTGKNTERLQYSLVIKSFKDGGEYVCNWELKFRGYGSSISRNSTAELPVLPYLPGPPLKEVFGILGNNVTLNCGVAGYPIMFEWRDEINNLIIGGDSRIRTEKNLLYIDDMNYDDRQKYKCLGIGSGNETVLQTISLKVKGSSTSESGKNTGVVVGISVAGVFVLIVIVFVLVHLRWKRKRDGTDNSEAAIKFSTQPDYQEED